MSENTAPTVLWDDWRIFGRLKELGGYDEPQPRHGVQSYLPAEMLAFEMRDELDARIAELERQLTEARTRLSGTEAAWDNVESLMFGGDDDE